MGHLFSCTQYIRNETHGSQATLIRFVKPCRLYLRLLRLSEIPSTCAVLRCGWNVVTAASVAGRSYTSVLAPDSDDC